MPDSLPRAEDASLYVLDLLDSESRRTFESELAASPDLQRHVADLQANVEALALASPPCNPSPRVWSAIAQRTALEPAQSPEATFTLWGWIRASLTNGWAVATVVAIAFATHLFIDLPSGSRPAGQPAHETEPAGADVTSSPGDRTPGNARINPASRETRLAATSGLTPSNSQAAANGDASRLQDRVRLLSEQVAMLTHVLAQRSVMPPGSAQLQLFRLVSSNAPIDATETFVTDGRRTTGTPAPSGVTAQAALENPTTSSLSAELPLTLALAAARQFASLSPVDSTPVRNVADGAELVSRNSAAMPPPGAIPNDTATPTPDANTTSTSRDSIQVVDLAQSLNPTTLPPSTPSASESILSAADGSAFGAYSPETGQGAIAFRLGASATEPESVLQLWLTDPHSGLIQSVGFTSVNAPSQSSQVIVMKFSTESGAFSTPTFLITREPAGGSIVPTGPIVAQPPPSTVFPPNP